MNVFFNAFLLISCSSVISQASKHFHTVLLQPRVFETTIRQLRNIHPSVYFEQAAKLKIIELGEWALELNPATNLVVDSSLKAEWVSSDGRKVVQNVRECDYRKGVVRGLETSSIAVATVCGDQVTGYINVAGSDHFFQPVNASSRDHVLFTSSISRGLGRRKRSISATNYNARSSLNELEYRWVFNLTGDTISIGNESEPELSSNETEDNEEILDTDRHRVNESTEMNKEWHLERFAEDEIGYFYDTAWTVTAPVVHKRKGPPLPTRWLEIALGIDHTVIAFHGKDKVEQYVLALMNIVSAIYQDPSLDTNLKLIITRILFYENKKQSIVRVGNAKKSLENANSWNRRLHMSLAPGEPRHDVAVWLTRADIGGPSGYAPVSGTCDPQRSCALNRDEGLSSAFIIAHEIGHILGLSHDGDKKANNDCSNDALDGSVMAPMVAATFNKFLWSECSRKEFRRRVQKWTCLSNPPSSSSEIELNATHQHFFTMDEQCRMEFGDGYVLCRSFDIVEPCSHLWCGHVKSPLVCKTKKGPPLEGTECGFDKWCVDGYCEDIGKHHLNKVVTLNPQDGGWSDWSSWGPCSQTCGIGIQFRTRKCNNPEPANGGADCEGLAEEWQLCNKLTCPDITQDLRTQQCARLPRVLNLQNKREANLTWLPYESEQIKRKCKLTCISEETNELFLTNENLIDGTPCSYDNDNDICVQGECQLVGCDGKLNSTIKTDNCGVCGGDNSSCINMKKQNLRKLKREVTRVSVLPRFSRNIQVQVNVTLSYNSDPSVVIILKNRKKKKYTVTVPNAHPRILEGTKFHYRKQSTRHEIWAKGPVLAEMVVLVYAPQSEIEAGLNVSILSKYVIHRDALIISKRYHWIMGGWGPCSASCGGGKRQKTVACWDKQNNKIVRRKFCSLIAKPVLPVEKCNTFECNFQWIAGEWEPCSATCGSQGVQHRELYCVPQSMLNRMLFENNGTIMKNPWMHMVNPNKCSGITPQDTRFCNRYPCPSYWEYGNWSQCSVSCGTGTSVRHAYCPPLEHEDFFSCGEAPATQKRTCRGAYNRHTNKTCKRKVCKADKSVYCSLDLFFKYCKLKGFRRLCCKSCRFHLKPISV